MTQITRSYYCSTQGTLTRAMEHRPRLVPKDACLEVFAGRQGDKCYARLCILSSWTTLHRASGRHDWNNNEYRNDRLARLVLNEVY